MHSTGNAHNRTFISDVSDIDECAIANPCSGNGECFDQVNHYICVCMDGYTGSTCDINIDDCLHNPCIHGNCTDDVNSFNCTCESGYEGPTCAQSKTCRNEIYLLF